jgi:hypothetical protein
VEFQYTDEKNWAKKAYSGFVTAMAGLILIVFQFYFHEGTMDGLFVFLSFVPFLAGLIQGIFYMSRHEREYIYLEEDLLTIYKGPLFPRTKVYYNDIDYCIVVSTFLVFKLANEKEKQINTDLLSGNDFALLREELKKRVKPDLFRINPHFHNRININNE